MNNDPREPVFNPTRERERRKIADHYNREAQIGRDYARDTASHTRERQDAYDAGFSAGIFWGWIGALLAVAIVLLSFAALSA